MTRHLVVVVAMLGLGLPAMAHAQSARAQLRDARANVVGTATLSELPGGVRVTLRVNGLRPGEHGFHIHAVGKCESPDFTSVGAHFNPYGKHHGLANPDGPPCGRFPEPHRGGGWHGLPRHDRLAGDAEGRPELGLPGGRHLADHPHRPGR